MAAAIDRNNRIAFVEKFRPVTTEERDMLCRIFKVKAVDLVSLSSERTKEHEEAVNRLKDIFGDKTTESVRSALFGEGFIVKEAEGSVFAVNFRSHIIVDLKAEGFDLKRLSTKRKKKRTPVNVPRIRKFRDTGGGSGSDNREWEVGRGESWDEIDDGKSLKR